MKNLGRKITALLIATACAATIPLAACKDGGDDEQSDEYSVVLNYNDDSSRPRTVYVEKGEDLTAPDEPLRVGYQISHWSTAETGGEKINFPFKPSGDITLYAQWTAAVYDVTFDYNFTGSTPYVTQIEYNGTVSAPAEEGMPVNTGYFFYRWMNKAEDGSEVQFPYTVKKDVTFYAEWLSSDTQIFEVSFNSNYPDESGSVVKTVEVVEGKTIAQRNVPSVSFTGYTFKGWATAPTASADDIVSFPYKPTSTLTLYAIWERTRYSVNFRYNYNNSPDSGIFKTESGYSGDTVANPGNVTREGFTFLGWFDSATEGTEVQFPYTIAAGVNNIYAHWQAPLTTPTDNIFDAEFTVIDSSESYPGYSGSTAGTGIITHDSAGTFDTHSEDYPGCKEMDAHHGHHVIGLYREGAELTFVIHSDKAVSGVKFYAKLAIEAATGGVVFTPEGDYGFKITVNGENHNYGSIDLRKPSINGAGMYQSAFFEFNLGTISLKEGENVIKLITNNSTAEDPQTGDAMGTMAAIAPMVDYIRFETDATLSWYPEYDNLYRIA